MRTVASVSGFCVPGSAIPFCPASGCGRRATGATLTLAAWIGVALMLMPWPGSSLRAQTRPGGPLPPAAVAFGSAIAIAGEEIFVGRPEAASLMPMPPARPGGVHVFRPDPSGQGWTEAQALLSTSGDPGDEFGSALAAEGGTLVVGAPMERGGSGAAYVFERRADGRWAQTARLTATEGAEGDGFGTAVSVAGDAILVGAPGREGQKGAVFAYRRDPATGGWSGVGVLSPGDAAPGDRFGASVSLRGELAVVGAPGAHFTLSMIGPPPRPSPGSAYVFRLISGEWSREARLSPPDEGILSMGAAVLAGEEELFVGAPVTRNALGAVLHYVRAEDGAWTRAATLAPGAPSGPGLFGSALALTEGDLLVGAPLEGQLAGKVHVLRRESVGEWEDVQQFGFASPGLGDLLGTALAAGDGRAVVGAPGAELFAGLGYVLARGADGRWTEAGTIAGEAPGLGPIVGREVPCESGSARIFRCTDVDLVAFLPVRALGGSRGVMVNDVWGWTDPETGREYAIVGRTDGTAFVDVTSPARPVYVGELPYTEGATPSLWRDMKVYADHVFVVSDGAGPHGVQIFDLTRLREVTDPPVTFEPTAVYDRVHSAHNIVINPETGFAYVVGASMGGETCGGALHMIDVRDPEHPVFAGCFADPSTGNARTGYTHDAQCVLYRGPDAEYRGREICFNSSETALGIADVTDKEHPVPVSVATYPNVAYAHQGWLSEDHRYFYLDDELDEVSGNVPRTRTLVWDVQDLDDPVLVNEYLGPTGATDHNLYVRGRYMYQSNYVSGLRILDIEDPVHPVEVGFFDTVPWGEDAPGFAGSWSNYPFFESGIIVVTSMREGLFLLRKREPRTVS